jgi:hypothetical protein
VCTPPEKEKPRHPAVIVLLLTRLRGEDAPPHRGEGDLQGCAVRCKGLPREEIDPPVGCFPDGIGGSRNNHVLRRPVDGDQQVAPAKENLKTRYLQEGKITGDEVRVVVAEFRQAADEIGQSRCLRRDVRRRPGVEIRRCECRAEVSIVPTFRSFNTPPRSRNRSLAFPVP